MKTKSNITAYIVHSIAAAVLVLTAQISLASSATWLLSPQDSAWENANNWTPGGPPNGPSDIATFAQSSQTGVNISTSEEVNSIVFTSDADSFTLAIPPISFTGGGELIISGTGVINNSSVLQTFETGDRSQMIFNNTSTAASAQMRIVNSDCDSDPAARQSSTTHRARPALRSKRDPWPRRQHLQCASTAPRVHHQHRSCRVTFGGGQTIFNDTSTAANASIDNLGSGLVSTAVAGLTSFNGASTAGHATITNYGGLMFVAGETIFNGSSTADSAILIANGGDGRYGGAIFFNGASTGGTARVEVFDNGYLDISRRQPGVTIGSIEGSGNVFLGANRLTVGANNINTSFSGVISGSGSLAKVGSGILTLQANDCIADTVGLILVSGSIIKLDFTGPPDVIASLKVNGVPTTAGHIWRSNERRPKYAP